MQKDFSRIFLWSMCSALIKLEVCRFKVIGKTHRDGRNVAMITGSKKMMKPHEHFLSIEAWYRNHSGVDFLCEYKYISRDVEIFFCGYGKVAIWGVNEETKRAQGRIWMGIFVSLMFLCVCLQWIKRKRRLLQIYLVYKIPRKISKLVTEINWHEVQCA